MEQDYSFLSFMLGCDSETNEIYAVLKGFVDTDDPNYTAWASSANGEIVVPSSIDISVVSSSAGRYAARSSYNFATDGSITGHTSGSYSFLTSEMLGSSFDVPVKAVYYGNGGSGNLINIVEKLTLPDGITSINCFQNTLLTDINIPFSCNFIGIAGNSMLTNIYIPNSITEISSLRDNGITELTIPQSVRKIWSNAFYNLSNLTKLNFLPEHCEITANIFSGCNSLMEIYWNRETLQQFPYTANNVPAGCEIILSKNVVSNYLFNNTTFANNASLKYCGTQEEFMNISCGNSTVGQLMASRPDLFGDITYNYTDPFGLS